MKKTYLSQTFGNLVTALFRASSPRRDSGPALALAMALMLGGSLLSPYGYAQAQEVPPPVASTVNINTADAEALSAGLKGVGMSKATEIVRYRESYGPFASVEELAEVQGIGQSTLDRNRAVITLE